MGALGVAEEHGAFAMLAKRLGAARVFVVDATPKDVVVALGLTIDSVVPTIDTSGPIACAELRNLGAEARSAGTVLVVDNSAATFAGCATVRLGAHVSVESFEEGHCLVGLSHDVERLFPHAAEVLASLPCSDDVALAAMADIMTEAEAYWHEASDAAQVVASYLACHPRVVRVSYPGLRQDASFEVAARTLTGGFGPFVAYATEKDPDRWHVLELGREDPRMRIMELEQDLA